MKAASIEHLKLSEDANNTRQLKYKELYSVW